MRHLDTNDWLMMNGMIYKIYTMEDEKKCGRTSWNS